MLEHAALSGKEQAGYYTQSVVVGNYLVLLALQKDLEASREVVRTVEEALSTTTNLKANELLDAINGDDAIIVAQVQNGTLALAKKGQLGAKLLRNGKVINLLPLTNEEKTVHGPIQESDLLVLGTKDFFDIVTLPTLADQAVISAVATRDSLLPLVESTSAEKKIASLIASYQPDVVAEEPVETMPVTESLEEKEVFGSEDVVEQPPIPSPHFADPAVNPVPASIPAMPKQPLLSRLPKFSRLFSQGAIYLRRHDEFAPGGKMRKPLFLVLIAFLTLVCLVAFQLRSRTSEQNVQVVQAMEREVTDAIASAQKLQGLNDQIARETLLQTRKSITDRGAEISEDKMKELLSKIDKELELVSNIYVLSSLETFYDFGLLKSDPEIVSAKLYNGDIIALDANNGSAYSVEAASKKATMIAGSDDLKNGELIDQSETQAYVWSPQGIYQKSLGSSSQFRRVAQSSDSWGEIIDLVTFANNVYLLDKDNNQIWKYSGSNLTESSYLGDGLSLDFSRVNSMAIDGVVYVLSSSGNIVKFTGGAPETFTLNGLPDELSSPRSLFTTDEQKNIYFLDKDNSRVMVVDKEGNYVAQYLIPKDSASALGDNPTVLADEASRRGFLVSSDKVYDFELR